MIHGTLRESQVGGRFEVFHKTLKSFMDGFVYDNPNLPIHNKKLCQANVQSMMLHINIYIYFNLLGIQMQQMQSKGYALLCCKEGKLLFELLRKKRKNNEWEDARLSKFRDGCSDAVLLKDSKRIIRNTSLSLLLFIQHEALLQELRSLGTMSN